MTTLLAFAIILGPVIVFHEFGHFIVAKLSGIYVKTFSVGFGPKLLKFRIGETTYALSAIPLGGYVKMAGDAAQEDAPDEASDTDALDDDTPGGQDATAEQQRVGEELLYPADEVPDYEIPEHRYFRNKPLLTRLAVITAGPFANLLLALIVMIGVTWHQGRPLLPTTTLHELDATSEEWAAGFRSGDVLLSINGAPVANSQEIRLALSELQEEPFDVTVQRAARDTTLRIAGVRFEDGKRAFPRFPLRFDTLIGAVKKDGPAANAGIQRGDRILTIEGQPVRYYDELADVVNPSIGETLQVSWGRDGTIMSASVVPEGEERLVGDSMTETEEIGRIQIEPFYRVMPVSFVEAVQEGSGAVWFMTSATAKFLGILVTGQADRNSIGGPIRIGEEAGSALRWGFAVLFRFMAFLSVNLFLLNLLPIPVLDGGHVMFLLIEAVRGEALSVRSQERLLRLGVSALVLLMGFVIVNDLIRVLTH
jgi:regulator of sigma E protease